VGLAQYYGLFLVLYVPVQVLEVRGRGLRGGNGSGRDSN